MAVKRESGRRFSQRGHTPELRPHQLIQRTVTPAQKKEIEENRVTTPESVPVKCFWDSPRSEKVYPRKEEGDTATSLNSTHAIAGTEVAPDADGLSSAPDVDSESKDPIVTPKSPPRTKKTKKVVTRKREKNQSHPDVSDENHQIADCAAVMRIEGKNEDDIISEPKTKQKKKRRKKRAKVKAISGEEIRKSQEIIVNGLIHGPAWCTDQTTHPVRMFIDTGSQVNLVDWTTVCKYGLVSEIRETDRKLRDFNGNRIPCRGAISLCMIVGGATINLVNFVVCEGMDRGATSWQVHSCSTAAILSMAAEYGCCPAAILALAVC